MKALLLVCSISIIASQVINDESDEEFGRAIQCKRDDGINQRCMPVLENVAFDRDVYANNTCGMTKADEYCVQTGSSGAKKICDYCDNTNPQQRHPAHLMTDRKQEDKPTWWQSDSLLENEYGVHLIIDFKKKYNVAFIRIRFHTLRPNSFAIYKKSTYDVNEEWLPYQYYSKNCEERYGVGNHKTVTLANQKIALCTDKASNEIPLSGGNVAYLTLDNRPGKKNFDKYEELQDWVTVTALKIDLDRVNTFGDEVFRDPKVLKSYYFAISDITVGGRCKCNGHASACKLDDQGIFYCECDHNTAGKDCEKCMPLFNDREWRPARKSANPCQACKCHNLADKCVFDEQLWVDSGYRTGGRCLNCKNNTDGIHCEECKENHFRKLKSEACKPCGCDSVGSRYKYCNSQGKCICRSGVVGLKCDQCNLGYYDFSKFGCRQCNCDSAGSVGANCDATGQCQCKENVEGKQCDKCKAGHFDLDTYNPKGCKECFCYGHGLSCVARPGIGKKDILSSFVSDTDDWRLEDEQGNSYNKNLFWDIRGQYAIAEPVNNKILYLVAPDRYLGNRLSSYAKVFSFLYGIFELGKDREIKASSKDIIFAGNGLTATYPITFGNNQLPQGRFVNFAYRLTEPSGMSTFDFQKVLVNLTAIKIRMTFSGTSVIDNILLESTHFVTTKSNKQVNWLEQCDSKQGHKGELSEECDHGYTRAKKGSGPLGDCVPCKCNNHADFCDPETSVCECKHNTAGDHCEICLKGFYGDANGGTPDDCKACPCVFASECILLNNKISCMDCPEGHAGDLCEKCADGYFGIPDGTREETRCKKCDCNGNINSSTPGNCNSETGDCLQCIYNTTNGPEKKCELCKPGFYGDALIEPKGNCSACRCFENGTVLPTGHVLGDPISCDTSGRCTCRKSVLGDQCDQCPAGYWNVASGKGCETCDCDVDGAEGTSCDVETGKCKCKNGVAGRKCDQCASGHYDFTEDGCTACDCHLDGSLHENCTDDGTCECLPGVLGVKCDRCPENKYNLSRGCIACPECFNIIQKSVNELRERLVNFNFTAGNSTDLSSFNIRDKNFEALLETLKKSVEELHDKVKGLSVTDEELMKLFKALEGTFQWFVDEMGGLEKMVGKSRGALNDGRANTAVAEAYIEQIKYLLNRTEARLTDEADKVSKDLDGEGDLSDTAKKLREIAEEARNLADNHEETADNVNMTSYMALASFNESYKTAVSAREKELRVMNTLRRMGASANESMVLANESHALIASALNISKMVAAETVDLLEEANTASPDYMINKTKEMASSMKLSAIKVKDDSTKLITDNKLAADKFVVDETEARKLMAEGGILHNEAEYLYNTSLNASQEALSAQALGLRIAKEAQDMLETLQGFNENIKRSKANATEAIKLIPRIKGLISKANLTGKQAFGDAEMSEADTTSSLDLAINGTRTTNITHQVIDDIIAELKDMINDTMRFMMNELQRTKDDVDMTNRALDGYEAKAIEDAVAVKGALNDSEQASGRASKAHDDLLKTLMDVEELMVTIEGLEDVDMATLEEAEKRFGETKETIEGKLTEDITSLKKKVASQESLITMYELDLGPLREALDKTNVLFNFIPKDGCFRRKGTLEIPET